MKCPICVDKDLLMSDKQGVEIDYCPECRGVWLDRGELDKLIEKTDGVSTQNQPNAQVDSHQQPQQKKKEGMGGMLGDFMDFGG